MNIQTIQTPDGAVIITSDLYPVTRPHVETEGRATVIRVGRLEIVVDPDAAQGAEAVAG